MGTDSRNKVLIGDFLPAHMLRSGVGQGVREEEAEDKLAHTVGDNERSERVKKVETHWI